jgi:hypothetical protein
MTVLATSLAAASIQVIRAGQTPHGAYLASPTFPRTATAGSATVPSSPTPWTIGASTTRRRRSTPGPCEPSSRTHRRRGSTPALTRHPGPSCTRATRPTAPPGATPGRTSSSTASGPGCGRTRPAPAPHRPGRLAAGAARRAGRRRLPPRAVATAQLRLLGGTRRPGAPSTLGRHRRRSARRCPTRRTTGLPWRRRGRPHVPALRGVRHGHFVKHVDADTVDANLLWLVRALRGPAPGPPRGDGDRRGRAPRPARPDGGVHRYPLDTYYGGGSWPLLTAALAQHHTAVGERDEALRLLAWIEAQATPEGHLPEQVATHAIHPHRIAEWEERWGTSASPLLWSHAAYLTLLADAGGPVPLTLRDAYPEKAVSAPGAPATLVLEVRNDGDAYDAALTARLRDAGVTVAEQAAERRVAPGVHALRLQVDAPAAAPRGYEALLELEAAGARVSARTALLVLEHWWQAPRYGFLTEFAPGEPAPDRIRELAKFHVTVLQFYDWMYRHYRFLPPRTRSSDAMGRRLSLRTVASASRRRTRTAWRRSPTARSTAPSRVRRRAPGRALAATPAAFELALDRPLLHHRPSPGPWREHACASTTPRRAPSASTAIHMDQYGFPKWSYDAGAPVDLGACFPGLIDEAARPRRGRGRRRGGLQRRQRLADGGPRAARTRPPSTSRCGRPTTATATWST